MKKESHLQAISENLLSIIRAPFVSYTFYSWNDTSHTCSLRRRNMSCGIIILPEARASGDSAGPILSVRNVSSISTWKARQVSIILPQVYETKACVLYIDNKLLNGQLWKAHSPPPAQHSEQRLLTYAQRHPPRTHVNAVAVAAHDSRVAHIVVEYLHFIDTLFDFARLGSSVLSQLQTLRSDTVLPGLGAGFTHASWPRCTRAPASLAVGMTDSLLTLICIVAEGAVQAEDTAYRRT